MASAGAAIAVLSRNEEKNGQVLAELKVIGVPAIALHLDVTERETLPGAIAAVEGALGGIDILVNNAGVATVTGGILNESPEVWDTTLATHLDATFLLSKLVAASMATRKRGKIINLASMYSYFGAGMFPSYGAAKGAIVQLTKAMAVELAPHNIQVNAIAPGWIETDMTVPVHAMPLNDEIIARPPRRSMGATGGNCWNGGV